MIQKSFYKSHPRFTHLGKTRMKIKKRLLWPKNHFKSLIRVLPIWVKRGCGLIRVLPFG